MGLWTELQQFYRGKTVFVTGHTGFKGSWLCVLLSGLGATVVGYALPPQADSLYTLLPFETAIQSHEGDIRDLSALQRTLHESGCQVVFHLAAQALVRDSYENPVLTYQTNLLGTVNLLEAVRTSETVRSVVNVTTDKVYENTTHAVPHSEADRLDGYDPYSNSKSCSELATATYRRSFLDEKGIAVSTARAGNVIGGGDFAKDRILPDCVRHAIQKEVLILRNPHAVRPFQHVIEPLVAYLVLAMRQADDPTLCGGYNVGPDIADCITTGELATIFCRYWGQGVRWAHQGDNGVHEAGFLALQNDKVKEVLGLCPRWNIEKAVEKTVAWYQAWDQKQDLYACMQQQISTYFQHEE